MMVLWTDVLFWLLLSFLVIGIWRLSRHTYWQMVWRHVYARPMAVVCMMVLLFFTMITILDSVHFNQSGSFEHVSSILDRALSHGAMAVHERSYSKPMATTLAVKLGRPNGAISSSGYAYLDAIPLTLYDQKAYRQDLWRLFWWGLLKGLIGFICLVSLWLVWLCYRHGDSMHATILRCVWGRHRDSCLAFVTTLLVFSLLLSLLREFSQHYHVMGTDKIGRDVLYMGIKSVRTAVLIGTLTTLLMLPFAIFFGLLAGALGGWVDDVVQYVYTTISSIPSVLLISAMVLVMQVFIDRHPSAFPTGIMRADVKFLVLCAVLGLTSWTQLCRLLRAEAMKLRELDYIHYARMLRVPTLKILFRHMLPNVTHIVLINIILDFSGLVLAESVLTYVGVGVDPSLYSWGAMVNAARLELSRDPTVWWSLMTVLVLMLSLVLSANALADVVRDALDPHHVPMTGDAHE